MFGKKKDISVLDQYKKKTNKSSARPIFQEKETSAFGICCTNARSGGRCGFYLSLD